MSDFAEVKSTLEGLRVTLGHVQETVTEVKTDVKVMDGRMQAIELRASALKGSKDTILMIATVVGIICALIGAGVGVAKLWH